MMKAIATSLLMLAYTYSARAATCSGAELAAVKVGLQNFAVDHSKTESYRALASDCLRIVQGHEVMSCQVTPIANSREISIVIRTQQNEIAVTLLERRIVSNTNNRRSV